MANPSKTQWDLFVLFLDPAIHANISEDTAHKFFELGESESFYYDKFCIGKTPEDIPDIETYSRDLNRLILDFRKGERIDEKLYRDYLANIFHDNYSAYLEKKSKQAMEELESNIKKLTDKLSISIYLQSLKESLPGNLQKGDLKKYLLSNMKYLFDLEVINEMKAGPIPNNEYLLEEIEMILIEFVSNLKIIIQKKIDSNVFDQVAAMKLDSAYKLDWNGQKNVLIDVFKQLRNLVNESNEPLIPNSIANVALFLKNSFKCFEDTKLSTLETQLKTKQVNDRPMSHRRIEIILKRE